MAEEEEVVAASIPAPSDHKRKLKDLEPEEAPEPSPTDDPNSESEWESESVKKAEEEEKEAITGADSDATDAKRPRLDLVAENGHQSEKVDEPEKEDAMEQPSVESKSELEDAQQQTEEAPETIKDEQPSVDDPKTDDVQQPSVDNTELENADLQIAREKLQEPLVDDSQHDDSSAEQQPLSETMTRKMEVPNTKVGVLIGKAGDTIRYLQYNSGCKIQIMRDVDANPDSATRPVELIGTLENITKAERLIKDVIAEADAGGSPSLVARGFNTVQAAGAVEQLQIQVPNEKVGVIIGKGGETIKNLQTRSGARIQLIPQHLPDGDQSKERTVRVTGDKRQIEFASELIKEVMSQPARPSPLSSGSNQQSFRPRGPPGPSQWGPRGPRPGQSRGYDYQQQGPYPSQNQQYPPHSYSGNYPPQQLAPTPRGSSNQGWEQRPPASMHRPPQSGGYDYYGRQGQGGHGADPGYGNPVHTRAAGPPPSQANYNFGQPQGPDYGQPYSQTAPPSQSYGQGGTHSYGGHGGPQPGSYPQGGTTYPGYGPQDQYGKPPPSYGMPAQGPPRASQPGDIPYQGPISSAQSYGPNAPPSQQQYPYASSGQMQQTYPQYGATEGYNQPPPAAVPGGGYPQQVSQPVSGYGQPGVQHTPGYAQVGQTGGYGPYPTSQPGYTDQLAPNNNAAYGYPGQADPAYGGAIGSAYPSGQPGYAQPAPTQPGYDQSIPQSGGYGSAPVGYGKSASPQSQPQPQPGYPQQYDATQMYGAHR